MRKMILTGALVLLGAGTTAQIISALAVCILWLTLIANFKPFSESVDDRLAQVEGLQVLFTLLVGLVLQLEAPLAEDEATSTIDEATMGTLLVTLNCTVVVLALLQQPIVLLLAARVRRTMSRLATKRNVNRDWEKAWVVAPSDDEYRACLRRAKGGGALAMDIWCDTASCPMRTLKSAPRALTFVASGLERSDDKGAGQVTGGKQGEGGAWHFDSEGAALTNPCEVKQVVDGQTRWIDLSSKRLLDAAPVQLFETPLFASATAWLDLETQTLLRAQPGILVFREPTETPFVGPVWRHRKEGTITSIDPAAIDARADGGGDSTDASDGWVLTRPGHATTLTARGKKTQGVDIEMTPLHENPLRARARDACALSESATRDASLQDGWAKAIDEGSGEPYYYNSATDETQWDPPLKGATASAPGRAAAEGGLPAGVEPQTSQKSTGWEAALPEDGSTCDY